GRGRGERAHATRLHPLPARGRRGGARALASPSRRRHAGSTRLRYDPDAGYRAAPARIRRAHGMAAVMGARDMTSVATAAATYLYCAVRSPRDPVRGARTRRPRGLPGAGPPRALEAGSGLWLVAATAPMARYGADAIDARLADLDWVSRCALAHDAVV